MMKIFLVFYAVIGFLKFLGTVACRIFRKNPKADTSSAPPSLDWYGVCDKCGNKAGLHKLNEKRYCAKCYAILKTEKDLGVKIDPDYWEKQNEHIKRT